MTTDNQFKAYAEEAIGWSSSAKTDDEKRALIELACTWALAAMYSERAAIGALEPTPRRRAH